MSNEEEELYQALSIFAENTNISEVIDITSVLAKYDDSVKEILADKQIVSRILKYSLNEFMQMDIEEIISCMDEPYISSVRMEPGHTKMEKVKKIAEEDSVPGEGKVYFDIRFNVYLKNEMIKILINIEAQKSTSPSRLGYHLDNRIIYYLGRMISSQKGVEFTKSSYDDLKAVRSIWICMDSDDDEDSINRISFAEETLFGKEIHMKNFDKVQAIIIRLRKNENAARSKNVLIAMLEELLRKEAAPEKKKKLSEEYGIVMSKETDRRVNTMCNLSEVVLERGIERGIKVGEERGIRIGEERGIRIGETRGEERGIQIGEKRGETRGITIGKAYVLSELNEMSKAGLAPEVIIEQLMKKFSETQEVKE